MGKFLFIVAATSVLALTGPAVAQYAPPQSGVFVNPSYPPPGSTNPGYRWREQRLNEDQRTGPQQDNQPRENTNKQKTLNNVGVTDPSKSYGGECAIGASEETCRRRGQKYNPPPSGE